ncbi:MAG: metallophosphoesterase, partial [Chlamydiales bacterium]|nr:metallophosphoesterase [Chlamydiales bacterium]
GDLSSTSLEAEFDKARQFICALKESGCQVFTIPGNHDHYTKKAYSSRLFYDYFNPSFSDSLSTLPSDLSLKKDKVAAHYLGDKWWVVGIDTALATSLFSACGHFSEGVEKNLIDTLSKIPQNHRILLLNHFPVFQETSIRNRLIRKEALKSIFERFPNIRFYLHGHTHRHCVADLRANGLPIFLDSGSTAHQIEGSWNMIEIGKEKCTVGVYRLEREGSWKRQEEHLFHV